MTTITDCVKQLHQGFDEVYHIEDTDLDDRDYFFVIDNKYKKRCKFIQIGPNNENYEISIKYNDAKEELKKIRSFPSYKILSYNYRG